MLIEGGVVSGAVGHGDLLLVELFNVSVATAVIVFAPGFSVIVALPVGRAGSDGRAASGADAVHPSPRKTPLLPRPLSLAVR